MKSRSLVRISAIVVVCMSLGLGALATTQGKPQVQGSGKTEQPATMHARGTFDVTLTPQSDDKGAGAAIGRMTVDKKFLGELDARSKGEMLSALTSVKGSAGYVAIERVEGALRGKTGNFVLQHSGTMTRGEQQLSVTVVPDSATGELAGLTGKMSITIAEGKHSYDFEYTLGDAR